MKPATAKGAGGRGEALRFAAPPKGEQGVMELLSILLCRLCTKAREGSQMRSAPAAGPSQNCTNK